jgi:hypothetical protein
MKLVIKKIVSPDSEKWFSVPILKVYPTNLKINFNDKITSCQIITSKKVLPNGAKTLFH